MGRLMSESGSEEEMKARLARVVTLRDRNPHETAVYQTLLTLTKVRIKTFSED